jgi:hypothetical protein
MFGEWVLAKLRSKLSLKVISSSVSGKTIFSLAQRLFPYQE